MEKIEILDKINNKYYASVPKPEYLFHPLNNYKTDLKAMEDEYIKD